jgi:hypothetical protein
MIWGLVCACSMRREKCAFARVNVQVFEAPERLLSVIRVCVDELGCDRPPMNRLPLE